MSKKGKKQGRGLLVFAAVILITGFLFGGYQIYLGAVSNNRVLDTDAQRDLEGYYWAKRDFVTLARLTDILEFDREELIEAQLQEYSYLSEEKQSDLRSFYVNYLDKFQENKDAHSIDNSSEGSDDVASAVISDIDQQFDEQKQKQLIFNALLRDVGSEPFCDINMREKYDAMYRTSIGLGVILGVTLISFSLVIHVIRKRGKSGM